MPSIIKNAIGIVFLGLALCVSAPSAKAVVQKEVLEGIFLPCYGMAKPGFSDPCLTANNNVIMSAWSNAAIVGWTGPTEPVQDNSKARIDTLESQNTSLQTQINQLMQKVNQLASQQGQTPISVTPPAPIIQNITQTIPGDFGTRLSSVEKDVKVLQGVVSMMEVNVGSLYARMDQLLAPIKKILKLK